MGRKKTSKGRRKRVRKEKEENVKDFPIPIPNPIPSEFKNKDDTHPELKAFDFINILSRRYLEEMLLEYGVIRCKHSMDTNIDLTLNSCRDLKKEEISRLDQLINWYFPFRKDENEKEETMKKNKRKTSSSTYEEDIDTGTEMSDPFPFEEVKDLHRNNIVWFWEEFKYVNAGFSRFRYNQCPNVQNLKSILETRSPDRILQETMLSLKITEEQMISKDPKEKDIRILAFEIIQDQNSVFFCIDIPEIQKYDRNKIKLETSETGRGVYFQAIDDERKNYFFEISNFANKIRPQTEKFDIYEHEGGYRLIISVEKKRKGSWKQVFNYRNQTKALWEEEMKDVLNTMSLPAQSQMEALDTVWNIALILVNCHADLLNLPHDLNHVNQCFKTLEEMIFYYKTMISFNPHLKALFYILGGALYKKLMKSNFPSSFKKLPKKKVISKYEKETMEKIKAIMEKHEKNFAEGHLLIFNLQYEKAYTFFDKASNFCTVPLNQALRGVCLLEMRRYREAIMDAIFALRNLGPYYGFWALFTILQLNIRCGNAIHATDVAISNEYYYKYKQTHEPTSKLLQFTRRQGLCILKNIFKSFSLLFQKKYKEAIPFLEKAESFISGKSGHTSVILLLLYFISKNYEKVIILGKEILRDTNRFSNLVYFLLGMSAYYMKQLSAAINYLEILEPCGLGKLAKFKSLRDLIHKADDLMISGKLMKDLLRGGYLVVETLAGYYKSAMCLAKDNEQLLAHIWTKLGVLNFLNDNFEEAVKCLTSSINLVGDNKNILLVRSEAYNKLGLVNEANKDHKDAMKYVRQGNGL